MAPSAPKISRLALPHDADDLIVFGGSFDPPTRAHMTMAKAARASTLPGGWLIFVPAARSPHKVDEPAASDADRTAMLELAIRGLDRAAIWADELDRAGHEPGPSYMLQTIHRLIELLQGQQRPDPHLRLLIGADQAVVFHLWRGFRELASLAEPLVMLRGQIHSSGQLVEQLARTGIWDHAELDRWAARVVPVEPIDASATLVRDLLGEGAPVLSADEKATVPDRQLDRLMDPVVLQHIRSHGLYRGPGPDRR